MQVMDMAAAAVTFGSLVYALYQGKQMHKLHEINRTEAWVLYMKTSRALGLAQQAGDKRFEQAALDILIDTIRLIKRSEHRFDFNSVDRWEREGRVQKSHEQLFRTLREE